MLRLLSTSTARVAAARVALRSCPAHVHRAALAAAIQPSRFTNAAAARTFTTSKQLRAEEDEEERVVPSVADARAALVKSLAEDLASLDSTNSWTQEYIQSSGLKIKTNVENQGVLATRTVDGHTIRVTFRADDFQEAEEVDEETEAGEEVAEEPLNEHTFIVDMTSPSGKLVRVDCSNAPDGELVIHSLSFPKEVTADPTTQPASTDDLTQDESALDFNDLNEPTQDSFIDLLESLGVDDDLALFVANQAQVVRTLKFQKEMEALKRFAQ